jgi:hypothetical protein
MAALLLLIMVLHVTGSFQKDDNEFRGNLSVSVLSIT